MLLVTNDPKDNILISEKELELFNKSTISKYNCDSNSAEEGNSEQKAVDTSDYIPSSIFQIFTLPSFYAFIIIWCLYCNSLSSLMFVLPTYLSQFLKVSIDENGFYCSLVHLGAIISVLWPHPTIKLLEKRFSPTVSARITYTLICVVAFSTLFFTSLFHRYQIQMFFTLRCFQSAADVVVIGSLLQNFAVSGLGSTAYSIVNTVGNLSIVPVSTFFGWLLDYTAQSEEGWTFVLNCFGFGQLVMLILYVTCIRSEPIKFKNTKKKAEEKRALEKAGKAEI